MFDGPTSSLSDTIASLGRLQVERRFCNKARSRVDRSMDALIARYLGYEHSLDKESDDKKKANKTVFAKAKQQREAAEKGDLDKILPSVMPLVGLILKSAGSRIPWDEHLKATEKEMERLAKSMPVWAWAKDVAGFGPKGLAIIVGEAGDLGNYPRREHLWKRLGLAVINGERQRKKSDLEEVRAHGYNPQRRAESWTLADSLFKHQWAGEASAYRKALKEQAGKDYDSKTKLDDLREIAHSLGIFAAAYATGPYGEVYEAAKMKARDKDWKDKHADNHARRLMWKSVVKDLRKAWKRLTPRDSQGGHSFSVAKSDHDATAVLASPE